MGNSINWSQRTKDNSRDSRRCALPAFLRPNGRLPKQRRMLNLLDKILLGLDKNLVVVMPVPKDGTPPLDLIKSIIVSGICRRLVWFERAALVVSGLKQVNSILCEACLLELVMLVETCLREKGLGRAPALPRLGFPPHRMLLLQTVLSMLFDILP